MSYLILDIEKLRRFCEDVFVGYGFSPEDSRDAADVLITADLYGIESHGVQRLIRYCKAIEEGSILPNAKITTLVETPVSAVWDAPKSLGQSVAKRGMATAIEKAAQCGLGTVTVRGSNHFGIAGYYASMAADRDMLGIAMTNTEAIAIPTHGKKAMLGTSPIAVCMPADPVDFWFDCATTVITRGKLEVYNKKELPLHSSWAADENGADCTDAGRVIRNICDKAGGGIFPLGGFSELTGSHKGYGLGIIVEMFTSIFSGGTTAPYVQHSGNADTSFTFLAIDYGIYGDKREIRSRMSRLLQDLRESPKAEGQTRIYTHGEKEMENARRIRREGVPVNEKTFAEMRSIASGLGLSVESYGLPFDAR